MSQPCHLCERKDTSFTGDERSTAVPPFNLHPRNREPGDRHDDETAGTGTGVADELLHVRAHTNLARGIVWADILADIAADEEARQQQRDAA